MEGRRDASERERHGGTRRHKRKGEGWSNEGKGVHSVRSGKGEEMQAER